MGQNSVCKELNAINDDNKQKEESKVSTVQIDTHQNRDFIFLQLSKMCKINLKSY